MSPLLLILQCFVVWLAKRNWHFTDIYSELAVTRPVSFLWSLGAGGAQQTLKLLSQWPLWANRHVAVKVYNCSSLSAAVSCHYHATTQINSTLLQPHIHLQSSSHSVPRGLTTRLAQQYIRPGLQHPSSLLHHHQCLDSISGSFCSTRDITTALKWCHGV